jgi:transposase
VVAPELWTANNVVIWDDLKPHKGPEVMQAIEEERAHVLPLPSFIPDLTLIEEMDSQVKVSLRKAGARTVKVLYAAKRARLPYV